MTSAARAALGVVTLLLATGGCDRRRSADDPLGGRVADAVPEIEKATGLRFKTAPKYELRSRDEVREFLLRKFDEDSPAEQLRGEELAARAFGLIPDTLRLRSFLLDLLTEQILGYYDPATKVLYVVRDAPDDLVGITLTHELVHALQDQYVNLDSVQRSRDDSDVRAAAQAVIEGHATWMQMKAVLGGGDLATRIPGGWDQIRQQIREGQASMPRFSNAPMAIQESLIFPYLSGAEFVRRFETRRDPRSPLEHLPRSTEQVLSETAFFDTIPDPPVAVRLPGRVAAGGYEETMGEFGTRLFLYQHGRDHVAAVNAAHGWGGDRYRVFPSAGKLAVVWATAWDSSVDAQEFIEAVGEAMTRRYRAGAPSLSASGVRTYHGSGRVVVVTPPTSASRNVVLFVDVPAGQPTRPIDAARISLGRE